MSIFGINSKCEVLKLSHLVVKQRCQLQISGINWQILKVTRWWETFSSNISDTAEATRSLRARWTTAPTSGLSSLSASPTSCRRPVADLSGSFGSSPGLGFISFLLIGLENGVKIRAIHSRVVWSNTFYQLITFWYSYKMKNTFRANKKILREMFWAAMDLWSIQKIVSWRDDGEPWLTCRIEAHRGEAFHFS